jgi:DNA invertase Pin-like site-specific DNA recombinase
MAQKSQATVGEMLSDFRGPYSRVARKLNVSASLVSRVADGNRASTKIEAAPHEESRALKDKLDRYL